MRGQNPEETYYALWYFVQIPFHLVTFAFSDSIDTCSQGTLIVCPASLIHHWKKEVEKYVKHGKLKVYLYHGPKRIKNPSR